MDHPVRVYCILDPTKKTFFHLLPVFTRRKKTALAAGEEEEKLLRGNVRVHASWVSLARDGWDPFRGQTKREGDKVGPLLLSFPPNNGGTEVEMDGGQISLSTPIFPSFFSDDVTFAVSAEKEWETVECVTYSGAENSAFSPLGGEKAVAARRLSVNQLFLFR